MPTKPSRKRDPIATRRRILAIASDAFATAGYDGAGVRDIAAKAGVTAMMINHYFGSKERLFIEVLASAMDHPKIVRPDILGSPEAARDLAARLVAMTGRQGSPLDGFLILLRSASNPQAARISREQIERSHQRNLAEAICDGTAPQRAAIALSLIAGFQFMRQMIGLDALIDADPDDLTEILTPVLELLMRGALAPD